VEILLFQKGSREICQVNILQNLRIFTEVRYLATDIITIEIELLRLVYRFSKIRKILLEKLVKEKIETPFLGIGTVI
jgi:hypothetical protein